MLVYVRVKPEKAGSYVYSLDLEETSGLKGDKIEKIRVKCIPQPVIRFEESSSLMKNGKTNKPTVKLGISIDGQGDHVKSLLSSK